MASFADLASPKEDKKPRPFHRATSFHLPVLEPSAEGRYVLSFPFLSLHRVVHGIYH